MLEKSHDEGNQCLKSPVNLKLNVIKTRKKLQDKGNKRENNHKIIIQNEEEINFKSPMKVKLDIERNLNVRNSSMMK